MGFELFHEIINQDLFSTKHSFHFLFFVKNASDAVSFKILESAFLYLFLINEPRSLYFKLSLSSASTIILVPELVFS